MGLGVLEPTESVVPGTLQLYDVVETPGESTSHLKHTPDGLIVLAPQPSDDPNDPLNWPRWRRDFNYFLILLCSILSLLHGPILAPLTIELAINYGKSVGDIAQLTSYSLLSIAGSAYIYSILSRLFGKRGLFIFAIAVLIASDVWAGKATTFGSMMGARVLSGFGQSMFEAMSLAVVPDLFFVHERGLRVSLYLFISQSGVTLGQPIATRIATRYGLNWAFYGLAISESVMLLALILFFWECAYRREHVDPLAHTPKSEIIAQGNDQLTKSTEVEGGYVENVECADTTPQKQSYFKKLRFYSGRISHVSLGTLTWRTLALNFHPTIFWAGISGLPLSWPVGISYTIALVLQTPRYNFDPNGISNMFLAAWVGTITALVMGASQDAFIKRLTKWNNNIYEPEFRLWYMIPAMIFYLIGMVGWGWGAEVGVSWVGLAFFFAFSYLGALLVNVAVIGYIIDGYRMYAVESQVILFAFKNFFPFGMGYFFFPWYEAAGPKTVFGIIGGVCCGIALLSIPFYIFGKRMRSYWDKHPYLGIKDMTV
ncbi:major facilitator superfamily domain-containing protein [Ilyonectria destructans]|nr:major facilitator superfamily domain-containing protein [Ilyonectria destructans]